MTLALLQNWDRAKAAVAYRLGIEESIFSRKYSGQQGWTPTEIAGILAAGGYSLIKTDELTALRVFARKGLG